MSDLRLNKYAAAILITGLAVLGLGEISSSVFHTSIPEKPGYLVTVATETDASSGQQGSEEENIDIAALLASADITAGQKVAKKCVACHSFDKGGAAKQGPPLWGIIDRDIASQDGFSYSDALAALPDDWTDQALYDYLRSPRQYAPGTAMNFIGLRKNKDRINIIAYLRSLAD